MSSLERYGDRNTRIGDAERNALSDLLRTSVDRGYLDLEEYEKRVETLMEAKTIGDAEVALSDLPAYQAILDAEEPEHSPTPEWVKWLWFGISIPIGINVGVWAFVLALTGNTQYFWPLWVVMPLLIVAGAVTVAERSIIRPAQDKKRRERRRNQRRSR